jgi:hypothetical protein
MLIDMQISIEGSRALLCETSRVVDLELGMGRLVEQNRPEDKEKVKQLKGDGKKFKRFASMLTPMSKYYCSEMSNRIAYDAIQVLGGSGYMRDYACERHARDARITTIYEGTSQLQIVAAVRGVSSGTAERFLDELAGFSYEPGLGELLEKLAAGKQQLLRAIEFVKQNGNEYMDLYGRPLVDIAIDLIIGYLFCQQASTKVEMETAVSADKGKADDSKKIPVKQRKAVIARRFINKNVPKITALAELICKGDKSTFAEYNNIVPPISED